MNTYTVSMCMCVYTHVSMFVTHTCMHAQIYMHMLTHMLAFMHTQADRQTDTRTRNIKSLPNSFPYYLTLGYGLHLMSFSATRAFRISSPKRQWEFAIKYYHYLLLYMHVGMPSTHMHAGTHACMYIRTYTHVTHTRTYVRTHTHTHTHTSHLVRYNIYSEVQSHQLL